MDQSQSIIIAVLSPILLTCGGIISWFLKTRKDDLIKAEETAKNFKIETYRKLLEPFIAAFTFSLSEKVKNKEMDKLNTLEYRKAIIDLTTFGSDQTLEVFNRIMQSFYHIDEHKVNGEIPEDYTIKVLALISEFLLQIRKDVYSKKTRVVRSDLIEFMLTDIEKHKAKINSFQF